MLFSYKCVSHPMEKMQEFIDFIFYEVWCKAPGNGSFRFELFDANADLGEVMKAFYYSDTKGGNFFYSHVEGIFDLFATLSQPQIDQFILWYQSNNDIEKVCANDPAVQIARYKDIEKIYPDLCELLASFFKGLYSENLLKLEGLREKIGGISDHYKVFMEANDTEKCPFCGLADMLTGYHSKREAYDHYLPKGLYPFNSINFRNLVPACHHCNSTYKATQDPSYTPKDPAGGIRRRKAFYPYATTKHSIEITIDLCKSDVFNLSSDDIRLTFGPAALSEEIETWREVYGIDERYKLKCLSRDAKSWARVWLEDIRIAFDTQGDLPEKPLATVQRECKQDPFANNNFLKRAFLEACERRGILETIAQVSKTS